MSSRGNLSLPQLAERYHIRDIFGGSVAYFSSKEGGQSAFTNFFKSHAGCSPKEYRKLGSSED